jgi:hypothetical protein
VTPIQKKLFQLLLVKNILFKLYQINIFIFYYQKSVILLSIKLEYMGLSFPILLWINSSNVFSFFNLVIKLFFFFSDVVLIEDQLILVFYKRVRLKEDVSK